MMDASKIDWAQAKCEEVRGEVAGVLIRCKSQPVVALVQHRGRSEGPYLMCLECADHNCRRRDAEATATAPGWSWERAEGFERVAI